MTRYIVFVAMLISIYMLANRGPQEAFLKAWLPFFLMLPFNFFVDIPGLPDPNFMQAAILPILFVLARDYLPVMRFGRMEILLLLYVAVRVFNDYLGRGYSDAQNYAFYMLSSLIGPYLMGCYLIDSRRMDIATSKMFVLIFLLFFPTFVYEMKFFVSPVFKALSPLFPNAGSGLSIRYGLARTAGTFEHPILAAVMIIAVYRMHKWLDWVGEWDKPQEGLLGIIQKFAAKFPFSFKNQISIILITMAIMTISRGPWIGGFAGATLVAVGNTKQRKKWLILVAFIFIVGGVVGKTALDIYLTPVAGEVMSEQATTMLYRQVMVDEYMKFLIEKMWTGWGLTTVPSIAGMESIDNAFFLMALQHGVLAPTVFFLIFLYAIGTQIALGLKAPVGEPPLGFTFSGIYLMCFIAFTTVYMGAQTEPMLFLLLGWGESIKNRPASDSASSTGQPLIAEPSHPFRRVIY